MEMEKILGTSLNLFTRQKYRCSKCSHKDWWNYSHMQWRGKLIEKPWSWLPWFRSNRPTKCKKCNKELNFSYGSGPDSWGDSYLPYWRGIFITLSLIVGGGYFLSNNHNIQIFEELAKLLFPGMQIN
jgi:hypothetical protein